MKSDGTQGCKKWGTIYKGSVCEKWEQKKVKITANTSKKTEVTNPEYIKIKEQVSKKYSTMDRFQNILNSLEVSKKVEVKNLEHTLKKRWQQVEKDWLKKQSEILREKKEELSRSHKVKLAKMQHNYQKGMDKIT